MKGQVIRPALNTPVLFHVDRIHFKSLLLIFEALNGLAPAYSCDLINVKKHERYSLPKITGTVVR